ncbi:heterokaryon incompatibility protein-domain-containing protein [Paraphoma chrysanthemicola]|uniref:Heterokaryon incompatibility protein-domain-containing protein n=1 Tax=Paraphoma chrysanthemicola TaxID=798071 RepID=A0A8K0RIJ7_9PLEO|nr:heterokaryon incompatibility protein-domain-containing protein [Paraphoma chrysanthemicola]
MVRKAPDLEFATRVFEEFLDAYEAHPTSCCSISKGRSLSFGRFMASADNTSIYRNSSGHRWVSYESCCIPHGSPEFTIMDANAAEFSSWIACLERLNAASTAFCISCCGRAALLECLASLRYSRVKVILGTLQHVCQKAYCPSCRSIAAEVATKQPNAALELAISIPTGRLQVPVQLIYCNNILATDGKLIPTMFTSFRCTKSLFPSEKYGRVWLADTLDLSLVKSWMEKYNSHSACDRSNCDVSSPKPTSLLLIDVNDDCLTASSSEATYLALSYVWGRIASFETTKTNIRSLCCKGALADVETWSMLPSTIRVAIGLTKSLGLRYLWVDRLCIIQDDVDRKMSLLRVMPFIYANAHFTIVAAEGSDANRTSLGISHGPAYLIYTVGGSWINSIARGTSHTTPMC